MVATNLNTPATHICKTRSKSVTLPKKINNFLIFCVSALLGGSFMNRNSEFSCKFGIKRKHTYKKSFSPYTPASTNAVLENNTIPYL